MPVGAGLDDLGGGEAFELGGLYLAVVGGGLLLPALGDVAAGGGAQADGGDDADDDDARADYVEGGGDAGDVDELDDQGREEGGGAAVEGHAQAGGEAALIGVPAGGAVGGARVGEADAEALEDAEGHIEQPGRARGHEAGEHEGKAQEDAADDEGLLRADAAEHPAAEDVARGLHGGHEGDDAGHGLGGPGKLLGQGVHEHRGGVDHAADKEYYESSDEYTGPARELLSGSHIISFLLRARAQVQVQPPSTATVWPVV